MRSETLYRNRFVSVRCLMLYVLMSQYLINEENILMYIMIVLCPSHMSDKRHVLS